MAKKNQNNTGKSLSLSEVIFNRLWNSREFSLETALEKWWFRSLDSEGAFISTGKISHATWDRHEIKIKSVVFRKDNRSAVAEIVVDFGDMKVKNLVNIWLNESDVIEVTDKRFIGIES